MADGILRHGGGARTEADRRALVEDLARGAIDQVAAQMIQQGMPAPTAEAEAHLLRQVVASQLGSVASSCSSTTTASRTSTSTGATTSG